MCLSDPSGRYLDRGVNNCGTGILFARSYGSVFKAEHKGTGQVLAIKQVPVDTDLQEIIKEISIMQQCDSPYIVKYYGSYFKNTDLWVSSVVIVHVLFGLQSLCIMCNSCCTLNIIVVISIILSFVIVYLSALFMQVQY